MPSLTVSPGLEACKAFGHLAGATTEEQARQFLSIAEPWVEREPNHYRHTDAAHAEALVRIAGAHPALRQAAVSQMCRALIADQRMAEIVLNSGTRWLRAEPAVVSAVCAEPASAGQHVRRPRDHRRGQRPDARCSRSAENARRGDQPPRPRLQGTSSSRAAGRRRQP